MGTEYSGYSSGWKPSGSDLYRKYRTRIDYWFGWESETQICYYGNVYVNIDHSVNGSYWGGMSNGAGGSCKTVFKETRTVLCVGTQGFVYDKGEYDTSVSFSGYVASSSGKWTGQALWVGTPALSVPALKNKTIRFHANTGDDESVPADQIKYYSKPLYISDTIPTKTNEEGEPIASFISWNTQADGGGTPVSPNQEISNPTVTGEVVDLYAQWTWLNQPTCEISEEGIVDDFGMKEPTKTFSDLSVTVTDIQTHAEDRNPVNVTLKIGNDVSETVTVDTTEVTEATVHLNPSSEGTFPATLTLVDTIGGGSGAVQEYPLGEVTVVNPTWRQTVTYSTDMPNILSNGYADITVEVFNYSTNQFDVFSEPFIVNGEDGNWSFDIVLGENYVSDSEAEVPETQIQTTFNHTESNEKDYRTAFYGTTRNANYSTGLSNTVFVSGCSFPNFSSRVWWSQVNNPLYFPDTNYAEVGSNDTSVQGLVKVGDYLGAIKQSKTTDTAIYLLYPTSFDDDTTFAIKQGVQGVGALAKYSFNILGDETLFLSPNGVMAIVPSEDDEHKVQNRSFFVDGKLLKEPDIESAYSFVYDGKYWLAVGGNCYVLDGNQRNSWGNDKTNLVYECYYLENMPATCFAKYRDELWFSDSEYVYRFTNGYEDKTEGNSVPVSCEWSTILDDDGSLHYLKTMQKKGNIVSILPVESGDTSAEVYIKKDAEEPIFVGEVNGQVEETGDIPNELVVRKKVKKYKRLQFIIRNNKAEGLGIDNITKSYVVGNYVKK